MGDDAMNGGPSYIDYYPEPLGHGRAIMRRDVVFDGVLVESGTDGSPAPVDTVRAHAHRVTLGRSS